MLVCQKHLAIVKTSEMLASALHGEGGTFFQARSLSPAPRAHTTACPQPGTRSHSLNALLRLSLWV